jgi:hypothetical protein
VFNLKRGLFIGKDGPYKVSKLLDETELITKRLLKAFVENFFFLHPSSIITKKPPQFQFTVPNLITTMASYVTNEHLSIPHDRVPMTEALTPNSQVEHRQRPKACQCCRARKVKCKAAHDESSNTRSRAAITKRRPQKKDSKPWFRTLRSPSQEDGQELSAEALQSLNALLYVTTLTSNERLLLSTLLPQEPTMGHLDLNAVMMGQVIPTNFDQGQASRTPYSQPLNSFDVFSTLDEGSNGKIELQ